MSLQKIDSHDIRRALGLTNVGDVGDEEVGAGQIEIRGGALVTAVADFSPVSKILKTKDVLLSIDGFEITKQAEISLPHAGNFKPIYV